MVDTENYQRVDAESEDPQGKDVSGAEAILISNTLVVARILGAVILVA